MRKSRNAYPCDDLAGGGVVLFQFIIQFCQAIWIGAEDNVKAICAGNMPAVGNRLKGRIGGVEQEREINLIRSEPVYG